jgi:hypothetical protein
MSPEVAHGQSEAFAGRPDAARPMLVISGGTVTASAAVGGTDIVLVTSGVEYRLPLR